MNHRCPGEWLTIELMERWLGFLVDELSYRVHDSAPIDSSRLPALPRRPLTFHAVRLT